jgi:polysaccharide export outer membrane protein
MSSISNSSLSPVFADSSASALSAYTISAGDELDISVLGHDELKQSVTVLPDGTFDFPIAGHIHAAGLSVESIEGKLTKGLSRQLNRPEVTVIAHDVAVSQVSVLGAVKSPGLYNLKQGWRLLEAIAASGGPAQDPVLTKITVIRDSGKQSIPIDFDALMQNSGDAQDITLQPGDVILAEQLDPSTVEVQVLGAVNKPATYYVPAGGTTIMNLLTQAGGPLPNAALSQVQIMHGGHVQTIDLRSHLNSANDAVANTSLTAGDVLMVPVNSRTISVLGEVRNASTFTMPDGSDLTPSQALSLAGGPTEDANNRKASILRRSQNGQIAVIPVDFDALLTGKSTANEETLLPGDVVYVPPVGQKTKFNPLALAGLVPFVSLLK